MAKVRTDWEALRDALEPKVALIVGIASMARTRTITNDVVVSIRGSRPFPTAKYDGVLDGRTLAMLQPLIAGAQAAIKSMKAG